MSTPHYLLNYLKPSQIQEVYEDNDGAISIRTRQMKQHQNTEQDYRIIFLDITIVNNYFLFL